MAALNTLSLAEQEPRRQAQLRAAALHWWRGRREDASGALGWYERAGEALGLKGDTVKHWPARYPAAWREALDEAEETWRREQVALAYGADEDALRGVVRDKDGAEVDLVQADPLGAANLKARVSDSIRRADGQRRAQKIELTGAGGGPVTIGINLPPEAIPGRPEDSEEGEDA